MTFDVDKMVALDLETHLIEPGILAPKIVCGSFAWPMSTGEIDSALHDRESAIATARALLHDKIIVGANVAFDFGCLAVADPRMLRLIFKAYAEGRVYDVQIAQTLHAIAEGNLYQHPVTLEPMRGRYSLERCVQFVLGRDDAKSNDDWRLRYALLDGVPLHDWPIEARQYPVDDAVNTIEVAIAQVKGGGAGPTPGPHRNLGDLEAQVETAWALHLGAMWGIRTDRDRVEALRAKVEREHADFVERFTKVGFYRDGKEDRRAVKRAVIFAYGGGGSCAACDGHGKVLSPKSGNAINCKVCSGTGLQLGATPTTPTGGVCADRDAKMESGDPDLVAFGDNEPEKVRDTYLPMLLEGVDRPITLRPNVLVASGRTSYDGLIQLLPRAGGVRETFKARDGYVYCSVDYAAGELCTLAQVCLWVVGRSQMAETINATGDPGALHTALGARLAGRTTEEMIAAVKAKDESAKKFRQAAKCFHPDTEALTKRGWVKIGELTTDDEVAAAIPTDDGIKIEWQRPTALQRLSSPGELVHLTTRNGINVRVTTDHRMLQRRRSSTAWEIVTPEGMGGDRVLFNAGRSDQGTWAPDERLLRLAVAVQADGHYTAGRQIDISVKKERKKTRLRALLNSGEYREVVKSPGVSRFILDRCVADDIKKLLTDDKKLDARWLDLAPTLRASVLDEVAQWDSRSREDSFEYFSTHKSNVDIVQALATLSGMRAITYQDTRPDKVCWTLSVTKTTDRSRLDNLTKRALRYSGDVVCLSVPSTFVIVRDAGVPIVVGQCANFGFGGGMGPAKLVIASRKKSAGTTTAPDGTVYPGIRFCILLGGAERCGVDRVTEWAGKPTPPICRRCAELAEELRRAWFDQWPEMRKYFNWVSHTVEDRREVPCFATERVRGGVDFTNGANNGFQALLADGAKAALRAVTRECYIDRSSALYKSRPIFFAHDEIIAELPEATAHLAGPRMADIMVAELQNYVPNVVVKAEAALMRFWDKAAEPVYRDGTLIPWEDR